MCEMTGLRASLRMLAAGALAMRNCAPTAKRNIETIFARIFGGRRLTVSTFSRSTSSEIRFFPMVKICRQYGQFLAPFDSDQQDDESHYSFCLHRASCHRIRGEAS